MTMDDDRFLHDLRRAPRPGFGRALRERLRAHEEDAAAARPWLRPALAGAFAAVAVAGLFLLPSVRAVAQSALDLFRVRTFTAVQFDPARLDRLRALSGPGGDGQEGGATLLGLGEVEKLRDPGRPALYPTVAAAAAAASMTSARTPAWLPDGMRLDTVLVQGEGEARITLHTARLRAILDALDLRDVQVPPGLDGRQLTVRMPPAVIQQFQGGRRVAHLVQAASPEVTLPPGADLAQLGEIGLRVLGLDPAEARRVAAAVDWRSTLLVPVPVNAASFRQVSVQGHPGLLVTSDGTATDGRRHREGSLLLWTEGDRVMALAGDLRDVDLLQIAESLR